MFICLLCVLAEAAPAVKCGAQEYAVRAHHRNEYVRSDGTTVRATSVKAHCKVRSLGYDYAASKFSEGVPSGWPHRKEMAAPWTEEEKERVIEAIDELPGELWPEQLRIYRMKVSEAGENPATNAEGIVALYDTSFKTSKGLGRIIAHEFAHLRFRSLKERERIDYRLGSGWQPVSGPKEIEWQPRKEGYVEEDGKYFSEEDYANNLEYFLYDPDKLKKVSPSAYDWLKSKHGTKFQTKGTKK